MQDSKRKIYKLNVSQIIDHTKTIRELKLKCAETDTFKFRAGQFAMLHVPTEGPKPALRAYSISSTDQDENGFTLIFKFVENGLASRFIWDLKGNEQLNFTGPFGKVFFQEPPTEQIIFLNTGSGVAQHLSYLYSKQEIYPNLHYKMLFGVRSEADIYYEKELQNLKEFLPNFEYHYVLSRGSENWQGKRGYVQNHLGLFEYKNIPTTFYLCGNGGMIKEVKQQLFEIDGIEKSKVWAEAFD